MTLEARPSTASIPELIRSGIPHVLGAAELGVAIQAVASLRAGTGSGTLTLLFEDMVNLHGHPIHPPLDTDYVPVLMGNTGGAVDLDSRTLEGFDIPGADGDIAGVYDLAFTSTADHTFTATFYGIAVSYHMTGAFVAATVRDGLIAAIAADSTLSGKVSAAASGNDVRVTELDPVTNSSGSPTALDAKTTLTTHVAHQDGDVVAVMLVGRFGAMVR